MANRSVTGSGVTAPYGAFDDTSRVELSSEVLKKTGAAAATKPAETSKVPDRKIRGMPMKKMSRVFVIQKNSQIKSNCTGVPDTYAFERGPAMITKIRAFLVKELSLAENAEEKSAEFVNRMFQITLEAFWTENIRGEEGFDRADSMLKKLGGGWTASFLAKVYPLPDKKIPQSGY